MIASPTWRAKRPSHPPSYRPDPKNDEEVQRLLALVLLEAMSRAPETRLGRGEWPVGRMLPCAPSLVAQVRQGGVGGGGPRVPATKITVGHW